MKISEGKEKILQSIVAIETELFQAMNIRESAAPDSLPTFKKMRWMTYSVLSEETLQAWLEDLSAAKAEGRNPLIEKYLMIEGKMPLPGEEDECCCSHISHLPEGQAAAICTDSDIAAIVEVENHWQNAVAAKYPKCVHRQPDGGRQFMNYLMCELHTWQPATVRLYLKDVKEASEAGLNLAEERYNNLYASIGRGSLKEVEAAAG